MSELQRQSHACTEAANALNLPVRLRVLPGHHDFLILDGLAQPDGQIARALAELVRTTIHDPNARR